MAEIRVERIHYGFLIAPEDTRDAGQPIPVVGYVVRHPDGLFLFDRLRADRRRNPRALSPVPSTSSRRSPGWPPADRRRRRRELPSTPTTVAATGLPGTPIYVQRLELEAAGEPDYTNPAGTHDFRARASRF
jgi:hypothetical protein